MALPRNRAQRDNEAFKENAVDGGVDRRSCITNGLANPVPVEIVDGEFADVDIVNSFNKVSSVAASGTVTVLTYTVPVGKTFKFRKAEISSDSVSEITVEIGGSDEGFKRLYYGNWNEVFPYENFEVVAGTAIKIIGLNCSDDLAKFEGRVIGVLI